MFEIKLTKAPYFDKEENTEDLEKRRLRQLELIDAVNDGMRHTVKLTTNIKDFEPDREDHRKVKTIKGLHPPCET